MTTSSPPSESDIRTLLQSSNCYSPSSIAILEDYLTAALQGQLPYMADAARTLLKLYQLFPAVRKQDTTKTNRTIAAALFLAFVKQAPETTDFLALTLLLLLPPSASSSSSSSVQQQQQQQQQDAAAAMTTAPSPSSSTITLLQQLVDQWNACQFETFWKTYQELQNDNSNDKNLQAATVAAIPSLQAAVAQVLALTYRQAPIPLVQAAMNVSTVADIPKVCSSAAVVESIDQNKNMVVFVATGDNTKRQRVYQQGVNFAAVSALLDEVAQ